MKKLLVLILAALMILTAAACGGGDKKAATKQESAGVDKLVEEYGFQWQDTKAPILNEKGACRTCMRAPTCSCPGRTCPSPCTPSRRI